MMRIDTAPFMAAMRQLQKEVAIEMHSVMRWQMGLWTRDIITKIYGDPAISLAEQKKAGENAIYGDLLGTATSRNRPPLFEGIEDATIDNWWEYKPGMKTVNTIYGDLVFMKSRGGGVFAVQKTYFYPDASVRELEVLHRSLRLPSTGRPSRAGGWSKDIGRWKTTNSITTRKSTLDKYVQHVINRVGRAKSTWLEAYNHFKQTVGMNLLPWNPPSWIERHSRSVLGEGVYLDKFDPNTITGEWAAGSNLDYGKDPQASVSRTFPNRLKDLQGGWALKRLKGRIEKFSAKEAREP